MMTAELVLNPGKSGPELNLRVTTSEGQLFPEDNSGVAEYLQIIEVNVVDQQVVVRSKMKDQEIRNLQHIIFEGRLLCL